MTTLSAQQLEELEKKVPRAIFLVTGLLICRIMWNRHVKFRVLKTFSHYLINNIISTG
jgi:hypothetical protein